MKNGKDNTNRQNDFLCQQSGSTADEQHLKVISLRKRGKRPRRCIRPFSFSEQQVDHQKWSQRDGGW